MKLILDHPEALALVVNAFMTCAFVWRGEFGKTLYWAGATLIALGLLRMRG